MIQSPHSVMTNEESQKNAENCCPPKKGCKKQVLGTQVCDCEILCEGERYKILSDQKDKNEIKRGEVIVYISGGGLAFCAHAASDSGAYIVPGLLFACTIIAVIKSFDDCLDKVKVEMGNIGKPKPKCNPDDNREKTFREKAKRLFLSTHFFLFSSLGATVAATIWDFFCNCN